MTAYGKIPHQIQGVKDMSRLDWRGPAISGAISALVTWALKEFSEATMKHVVSFLVTFSPILVGFLVFSVHSLIKDYRNSRYFRNMKYEAFHKWLSDNRNTGYPHMAEESLEGRIVAMLEWWDERKKKIETSG